MFLYLKFALGSFIVADFFFGEYVLVEIVQTGGLAKQTAIVTSNMIGNRPDL